jgi:hypothetical protein
MNHLDLRPLSLGEVLDRTFSLYRRHFLLFMGIAAIPHLLTLAIGLLQMLYLQHPVVIGQGDKARTVMLPAHGLAVSAVTTLVAAVLAIVVYLWSQGGAILAVTELYLGRQASISASLRRAWGGIVSLFGVGFLSGLAMFGGAVLLVIPGIYVACRLLVSVPPALVEGRGARESLSRSWNLTRGFAGRAFVLYALYFVLAIGMTALLGAFVAVGMNFSRSDPSMFRVWMSAEQLVTVLISTVISPFILIGTSLFYFDLRVRKEAFDLQFMMDPTSERMAPGGGPVLSILS